MTTDALTSKASKLRCVVYTRKSTEEGLDQEFNSLDAQREAGEAFIASQKHQGWEFVPTRYDDGGFTGANMDRPALQRLMRDIQAGQVDVVVVYKVDRLSRSLLDFARLIGEFDKHHVSFVSVTQQFNTASSLGRLVLNILLSFAQFEREMIAERTRDKMGAARRKGKWIGGTPPLGYTVVERKLVPNDEEAQRVRQIFALYLEERSLMRTVEMANGRGWRTKTWTTKPGKIHEGGRWDKSTLRKLLTNVTYTGKVRYRGQIFPGEHAPIVDNDLFAQVAELLGAGRNYRRGGGNHAHTYLLRGLVRCTQCDSVMRSAAGTARGKTYHYYACGKAVRRGTSECPVRTVPAEQLEGFVVDRIRDIGADQLLLRDTLAAIEAARQQARPQLECEHRQLSTEHNTLRGQARQLVATLATMKLSDGRAITESLAAADTRSAEIERRLLEIQTEIAAIERTAVDPGEVASALSMFVPVWDVLNRREQERVLQLLVEAVEYDGVRKEVGITFRATGISTLAREAASTQPAGERAA